MATLFPKYTLKIITFVISLAVILTLIGCKKQELAEVLNSSQISNISSHQNSGSSQTNNTNIVANIYEAQIAQDKLAIWFFTLPGQEHTGESILIRTANGKTILVDSGTPEAGKQVAGYLKKLGVNKIDYAIATHMHIDHIGGFPTIINKFSIDNIYTSTYVNYNTTPTKVFLSMAQNKQIPVNSIEVGRKIELDNHLILEFMHPDIKTAPPDTDSSIVTSDFLNDSSVVFKLTYKNNSILFTGDIHTYSENFLVERYGENLKADVIKVPHHGSSTSSSKNFIEAVAAKYSIMCIYAFNDINVYKRYQAIGERPYVTSLDGTVLMLSDGDKIDFLVEKERKGSLK